MTGKGSLLQFVEANYVFFNANNCEASRCFPLHDTVLSVIIIVIYIMLSIFSLGSKRRTLQAKLKPDQPLRPR